MPSVTAVPDRTAAAAGRVPAVRLSAAVMTHPSRLAHAERLRDQHPELDLRIVVDPAPAGGPCALRTARLAWQAAAEDATHHLVLQDDALPCAGFRAELARAIAARPDRPLSLFTEWGSDTSYAVRLAALRGAATADVLDDYVPTVGMVLPARLAGEFGAFTGYDGPHDDVALRRFIAAAGIDAAVTVPNLVEHAALPSVAGNGYRGAFRSACWAADAGSGTSNIDQVDWSVDLAAPAAVPFFAWQTGHAGWRVRPEQPGHTWLGAPGRTVLRDHGVHEANVASLGRASIRPAMAVMPDLGPKALFGLWVTGFGLGLLAGWLAGDEPAPVDQLMASPAARRALATMPGGALRFLTDHNRLTEVGDDLHRLVEQAVRQGYRIALNVRSAATPR